MAGNRLLTLKTERDELVDRLLNNKQSEKAKILVQIMDLDENINQVLEDGKKDNRKNFI